jgi:hypothetical protein
VRAIGPGLVTGASDDDPSGIATYSQAGAQYGLAFLWSALLTSPLMAAVQEICDRTVNNGSFESAAVTLGQPEEQKPAAPRLASRRPATPAGRRAAPGGPPIPGSHPQNRAAGEIVQEATTPATLAPSRSSLAVSRRSTSRLAVSGIRAITRLRPSCAAAT